MFIWYDRMLFSNLASTFLIGVIIIAPIKKLVQRERPFEALKEIKVLERRPTSRSFPSWHAYNIISQGLILIFLFKSFYLTILIMILTGLVAFSRVQLGVHYPSDVIFGCFFGLLGYFLSVYTLAPLLVSILIYFEQFITLEIQYHKINSLLFDNIFYGLLVLVLIIIIIIIAGMKKIRELIIRK
jgi:membrane-associated phospholipid phosphatase